jgi:hypothetical protein
MISGHDQPDNTDTVRLNKFRQKTLGLAGGGKNSGEN